MTLKHKSKDVLLLDSCAALASYVLLILVHVVPVMFAQATPLILHQFKKKYTYTHTSSNLQLTQSFLVVVCV